MNNYWLHFPNGDIIQISHEAETKEEFVEEIYTSFRNWYRTPEGLYKLDNVVKIQDEEEWRDDSE
jgi:dihydrodipicolinate reductase